MNPSTPQFKRKYKVMIVEDEKDSREVLVRLLESVGLYEVIPSDDGPDCLQKLEEANPKLDLVLLDIVMPSMDGIEALKRIRQNQDKYGYPIVVMLTNLGGEIAIETVETLGAQGYLMKIETEPAQLLESVAAEFVKFEAGNYPVKITIKPKEERDAEAQAQSSQPQQQPQPTTTQPQPVV